MKINIIDNFLEPEDLLLYRKFVLESGAHQKIVKDETLVSNFWSKYSHKLSKYCSGLYPHVTITNSSRPVIRHTDAKINGDEQYKMLIYLNRIQNGGTIFYKDSSSHEEGIVMNKENRAVVFDINLPHESQKFVCGGERKMAIGFRLLKK